MERWKRNGPSCAGSEAARQPSHPSRAQFGGRLEAEPKLKKAACARHTSPCLPHQRLPTSLPGPVPAIEVPLVLEWTVNNVAPRDDRYPGPECSPAVAQRLCRSANSECTTNGDGDYSCQCRGGYDGNPYLDGGCQVSNGCDLAESRYQRVQAGTGGQWLLRRLLQHGGFVCRCPPRTSGDHTQRGGCVPAALTGSSVGIGLGSGAGLILLVLVSIFVTKKIRHRRVRKLKQKFFSQNRGQLLHQLVSQRADIAERMIITLDELEKATNNFDRSREIGGGGHGTVYKGILSDLQVVAIKKSKITIQKEIDEFINKVAILSQINHRNIVRLLGCCLEKEVPLLVYEFISNGTLFHHLHVEGPTSIPWDSRLRIAAETAKALAYLHWLVSTPVIHRDIKSSNILLDDTITSKVSDFGASRYAPMDSTGLTTKVQVTIGYLDPSYFYTSRLTERSDVFSFGVILVELLTRKKPFSYLTSDGEGLVAHFVRLLGEGNVSQILDPQVIEEGGKEVQEVAMLAASCINLRAEERPTMREVGHALEGLQVSKNKGSMDPGCSTPSPGPGSAPESFTCDLGGQEVTAEGACVEHLTPYQHSNASGSAAGAAKGVLLLCIAVVIDAVGSGLCPRNTMSASSMEKVQRALTGCTGAPRTVGGDTSRDDAVRVVI
ncbi:wall-associated receptor kinase 2-like [Panicum miliaceum]|uniref:Wall-associated receptor kinase 2-like n=1 Tax=Panicum miliaceum TaxID=4540 RepID=A0A3L6TJQ2_PANMI|nr:wall-associated receptor kinase 2-like [Panicum miliaceum]